MVPSQDRVPIVSALEKHLERRPISLHVPAHRSGRGIHSSIGSWLGTAAKLDLTELPGLDDLHHPEGPIQEAQLLAAQAFGADRTYFLVNGSTSGNYAMLLTACRPGDKVLVVRDCHVSVIRGLQLSGATPIYLVPELDSNGYPVGVSTHAVSDSIRKHPDVRALFLTSPTYRGACSQLREIVEIAHDHDVMVLVDEAHGAHFTFHPELPPSAMEAGADMAVQSTHKTLGSLTQSAMLHVQGSRISYTKLEAKLRLVQSTSPSYLLLASLDAARCMMQSEGKRLHESVLNCLELAVKQLEQVNDLQIVTGVRKHQTEVVRDPFRWWIQSFPLVTGFDAAEWLRKKYRIYIEFADPQGFLIVWTYADTERKIDQVTQALIKLFAFYRQSIVESQENSFTSSLLSMTQALFSTKPEMVLKPAVAQEADCESIPIQQLAGRIAGEAIIPYPPGIPAILPGERWTSELRESIEAYVLAGGRLQGVKDPTFHYSIVITERNEALSF